MGVTIVRDVDLVGWGGTATIFSLGDVELGLEGLVVNSSAFFKATRRLMVTFTGKFYLGMAGLNTLLVNSRVIVRAAAGTTLVTNADIDFFFSVNTRVWERSSDSSIFPCGARSAINVDFSLYSRQSSLRDSVTPVRRREDTEGDGNAGVKVQIDCTLGVFSRIPFELLRNNSKGETRKD
jgi:hypothetical protein